MGKITFILGGARSGKSSFALGLAKKYKGRIAFVATAEPGDAEMKARIRLHKKARPAQWHTFEEPCDLAPLITENSGKFECAIIDCLTLLISNLILSGLGAKIIKKRIKQIIVSIKDSGMDAIIISNETGLGIVPENKLARSFRDIAGTANQIIAKGADEVFFIVAGIPWRLK